MSLFKYLLVIMLTGIFSNQLEAQNHIKTIFDKIVDDSTISKFNIKSICEYKGIKNDTTEMSCKSFDGKGNLILKKTRDYSTDYYRKKTYNNNIDSAGMLQYINVVSEKIGSKYHQRMGLSKFLIEPSYDNKRNLIEFNGMQYKYNTKNQLIETKILYETERYKYDEKERIIEVEIDFSDTISCYQCNKHILWKRSYNKENRIASEYRESKLYTKANRSFKYDGLGRLTEMVTHTKIYEFGIPINDSSDYSESVVTTKYNYKNNLPYKVTQWMKEELISWQFFQYEFYE